MPSPTTPSRARITGVLGSFIALLLGLSGTITAQTPGQDAFMAEMDAVLAEVQADIDTLEGWISDPDIVLHRVNGRSVPIDLGRLDELLPIAQLILAAAPGLEEDVLDRVLARSPEVRALYGLMTLVSDTDLSTMSPDALSQLLRTAVGQTADQKRELLRPLLRELRTEYSDIDAAIEGIIDYEESVAAGFEGSWTSTYGDRLLLLREGSVVQGEYDYDNGRVDFDIIGDRTLDGYWIEDGSDRACDVARNGSDHWGRLVLVFSDDFSSYSGTWGYCEDEPGGSWVGERITE